MSAWISARCHVDPRSRHRGEGERGEGKRCEGERCEGERCEGERGEGERWAGRNPGALLRSNGENPLGNHKNYF